MSPDLYRSETTPAILLFSNWLTRCPAGTRSNELTENARYEEEEHFQPDHYRSDKACPAGTQETSLAWLMIGIGFGAGAALLLTPSTGRELRNAFARGYRRTADGVSRGTEQLRRHGSSLMGFTRRTGTDDEQR